MYLIILNCYTKLAFPSAWSQQFTEISITSTMWTQTQNVENIYVRLFNRCLINVCSNKRKVSFSAWEQSSNSTEKLSPIVSVLWVQKLLSDTGISSSLIAKHW